MADKKCPGKMSQKIYLKDKSIRCLKTKKCFLGGRKFKSFGKVQQCEKIMLKRLIIIKQKLNNYFSLKTECFFLRNHS